MLEVKNILASEPALGLVSALMSVNPIRKQALKMVEKKFYKAYMVEKKFYKAYVEENIRFPRKVQEDKFMMARNMMWAIDRVIEKGNISQAVLPKFLSAFGKVWLRGSVNRAKFREEHGMEPPVFLTLSPTKFCNLQCTGCYANSSKAAEEKLPYQIVDRIVTEKTELWGSHFTVLSGGEPSLYQSDGKTVIDLAAEHNDNLFLMYTNGTTINEKMAQRLAEAGNITPAISVEGFQKETDERRGKGTFAKILRAFENLKAVGVPFGISITANRHNAELVVSDEFMDYYFDEMGAMYGWIFQYMPIGRSHTLDLMVTEEQRLMMWQKERDLIDRGLFIVDFWNCGTVSNGCISAGKDGNGYLYIDWNGNVFPCVFNPYYTHNIVDIYQNGGDLNTALNTPFMETIRQWHHSYILDKPPDRWGNILRQCAIRDHFRMMRRTIELHQARGGDAAAEAALQDENYYEKFVAYGERVDELTRDIWDKEYLQPEREGMFAPDEMPQIDASILHAVKQKFGNVTHRFLFS
jgi:MoaA/NifB/PqqE/SkfB family radical SAM enzyme